MDERKPRPVKTKGRRYFTLAEIAEVFGVSKRTVQRWVSYGWLPVTRHGIKITRVWVNSLEELKAMLAKKCLNQA